jgi:DNA-binding transcriptional ArsR family regulator
MATKPRSPVATFDPFPGVDLAQVSGCMRALAHPARLRLVALLLQEDLPVGAMAERLRLSQPTVSRHLGLLQARGMLTCRREGKHMLYRAASPALAGICTCIRSHFTGCPVGQGAVR